MEPVDLSSLIIKKVNSVSTTYTPCGAGMKRKNRERWGIIIKYEGETVYHSNGKSFVSDFSHLVILPMGCDYEWRCTREGHFSFIEFECDKSFDTPIVFTPKNSEKILKIVKVMEERRGLKLTTEVLESIRDTYSVLLMLAKSTVEQYLPSEKRQKLMPAIDYISKNYTETIKNDFLAELCGMSCVYFRKLFKSVMGTSPIAYARSLRIRKAKEMLKGDYGALSDIAFTIGYPSLYDFSRDFKKHTGKAPSKYQ